MNEAKKGVVKAALMTFGLTLAATIVGGIIVERFIRSSDEKAAAAALAANKQIAPQPTRQVITTTLPIEEQAVI